MAMLQQASIASGAVLALVLVIVLCLVFYARWHQQQKRDRCSAHSENGFDAVDGLHSVRTALPELRPFGPHHQKFIPLSEAYSNR